jgi:putative membrane protein
MKNLYSPIFMLWMTWLLVSCAQDLTYTEAMRKNRRRIEDAKRYEDATFLVDAKSMNLLILGLAQHASENGYAAAVVDLSKKVIADHLALDREINTLARRLKITVPSTMSDMHQTVYDQITRVPREEFDQKFLQQLKMTNQENLNRFTYMATEANDGEVRAFAARRLDVMRLHNADIAKTEGELINVRN